VGRGAGRSGVLLGYAHVDRTAMFSAARRLAAAVRESLVHRPARGRETGSG